MVASGLVTTDLCHLDVASNWSEGREKEITARLSKQDTDTHVDNWILFVTASGIITGDGIAT